MWMEALRDAAGDVADAKREVIAKRDDLDRLICDAYAAGNSIHDIVEGTHGEIPLARAIVAVVGDDRFADMKDALYLAFPEDDGTGMSLREARGKTTLSFSDLLETGLGELVREPDALSSIGCKIRFREDSFLADRNRKQMA